MKQTVLLRVVSWALAVVGAGVFLLGWSYDPRSVLQERVAGQDGTSGGPAARADPVSFAAMKMRTQTTN